MLICKPHTAHAYKHTGIHTVLPDCDLRTNTHMLFGLGFPSEPREHRCSLTCFQKQSIWISQQRPPPCPPHTLKKKKNKALILFGVVDSPPLWTMTRWTSVLSPVSSNSAQTMTNGFQLAGEAVWRQHEEAAMTTVTGETEDATSILYRTSIYFHYSLSTCESMEDSLLLIQLFSHGAVASTDSYEVTVTFDLSPLGPSDNWSKFEEKTLWQICDTRYHSRSLWHWPFTTKMESVHLWFQLNVCNKFERNHWRCCRDIEFTSLFWHHSRLDL